MICRKEHALGRTRGRRLPRLQSFDGERLCAENRTGDGDANRFAAQAVAGRLARGRRKLGRGETGAGIVGPDSSIAPVSTSIASTVPAGADRPFSSRSTESDFASWKEPAIATRMAPMRIVRSVTGLSVGGDTVSLAAGAETGTEEAGRVDAGRGIPAADVPADAGGCDDGRAENGGIDEISAARSGGMEPVADGWNPEARTGATPRVPW